MHVRQRVNGARWDVDAVRDDVRDYAAERLGPGGVLIIDDTGFVKKGTTSAGVGRQYTGTSGKIDNCQIGVFAAYATSSGRALVDRELYLPKAWTSDRERCRAAKIPDERGFATKGELAREIVRRCLAAGLPAAWVTADEAYGQDWNVRRLLEQLGLGYVVAVPKSQQIKSLAGCWRIDQLIDEAPADVWQRLSCGDGAKGPRGWLVALAPFVRKGLLHGKLGVRHSTLTLKRMLATSTPLEPSGLHRSLRLALPNGHCGISSSVHASPGPVRRDQGGRDGNKRCGNSRYGYYSF